MMNHEIYSHVRLQRCNCIDEKMLHVLSCILVVHWFHVFHPIYSVTFAASLFWKCFRLYICFIVQVSIASKYLFVSTVEDQVMIINCNNMMGVILL